MKPDPKAKGAAEPSEDAKKKKKTLMIGLIAGGGVLLLCCCTGVVSTAGWYFLSGKTNETLIVGLWQDQQVFFDFRADKKLKRQGFDLVYKFVDANTIEIGPDKQGNNTLNGQPYPTIRYRIELKGDILTLTESSPPPPGADADMYVLKRK